MTHAAGPDDLPASPPADDKDWTWVLSRRCPECGFDATALQIGDLPERIRASAQRWASVLARTDVRVRPVPVVWSPLEYAAHVRDVYRLFAARARLMLDQDNPTFDDWDQDATAVEKRYHAEDPARLTGELTDGSGAAARVFGSVTDDEWGRTGRRSNGSVFTVDSLGRYFLHDVLHHLHDVGA